MNTMVIFAKAILVFISYIPGILFFNFFSIAHFTSIMTGEQFTSGFVNMNPNSKIPAALDYLQDGSPEPVRLFESASIMYYLAEKYNRFLPPPGDVRGRAEVSNWVFWQIGVCRLIY